MTAKEQHKEEMRQVFEWSKSQCLGVMIPASELNFNQWYEENFSDPESLKISKREGVHDEHLDFIHNLEHIPSGGFFKIAGMSFQKLEDGFPMKGGGVDV